MMTTLREIAMNEETFRAYVGQDFDVDAWCASRPWWIECDDEQELRYAIVVWYWTCVE